MVKTVADGSVLCGGLLLVSAAMLLVILEAAVWNGAEALAQNERLVGTIEGGPITGAVIDDGGSGGQIFYRLHEALPDGSKIVKVFSDHVLLRSSDGTETELYTTAGSGGSAGVSRSYAASSRRPDAVDRTSAREAGGLRPPPRPQTRPSSAAGDVDDVVRPNRGRPNGPVGRNSEEWKARRREFQERRGRAGHGTGGSGSPSRGSMSR